MWVSHSRKSLQTPIVIILMVMDVTQEDVIEYYGTWYGSNHGGLPTMFVDPKHIADGLDF